MTVSTVVRGVSAQIGLAEEELLQASVAAYLREKKRLLMAERFEILSRYQYFGRGDQGADRERRDTRPSGLGGLHRTHHPGRRTPEDRECHSRSCRLGVTSPSPSFRTLWCGPSSSSRQPVACESCEFTSSTAALWTSGCLTRAIMRFTGSGGFSTGRSIVTTTRRISDGGTCRRFPGITTMVQKTMSQQVPSAIHRLMHS